MFMPNKLVVSWSMQKIIDIVMMKLVPIFIDISISIAGNCSYLCLLNLFENSRLLQILL